MTKWYNLQASLSAALSQRDATLPEGLKPLDGGTKPQKRFNVYRNNVALSLINVITDTFPVVEQVVGIDFFKTMAREFILEHLPASPVMLHYGADFPAFIHAYEPARSLHYLSDVAALEWARNCAFHAEDASPIAITTLANFTEDQVPGLLFTLHPSIRLQSSAYPIVSIWKAHQQMEETIQPNLSTLPKSGEAALIMRPSLDVLVRPLSSATLCFMKQLHEGATFAQAAENASEISDDSSRINAADNPSDENAVSFDISANLAGLFSVGAVIDVKPSPN